MTLNVSNIGKPMGGLFTELPVDSKVTNYLLILMMMQSKTADYASQRQEEASKNKKAATFMQGLINAMKSKGDFSPNSADDHMAFLKQITEKLKSSGLSYNEELVLKQLNGMLVQLKTIKEQMEKVQKEMANLQSDVSKLQKAVDGHQKELSKYMEKFKKGGAIVPGYNAYLAAKIIEYKGKRDAAKKELTLKQAEFNSVKQPELEALKTKAQTIQKSFEGNKETEANKLALNSDNELTSAESMLDAAMSSSSMLKP